MGIMTREEFLKGILEDKVVDYNNPNCINCNDCCSLGSILTDSEYKKLKNYFTNNPKGRKIHAEGVELIISYYKKGMFYAMCPLSDPTTKKCKIYDRRPKICRDFHCKKELDKSDIKKERLYCNKTIIDIFFERD